MVVVAGSLSACVFSRTELDIPISSPAVATDAVAFLKITEVRDNRHFEGSPSDAGTPSLSHSSEITDKRITARAVGRKRNGYGMGAGDYVLPEGKTVADLVRATTERALRAKGYAVVDAASPRYAEALPVSVDIVDFWTWISPGFAVATLRFKATVTLTSDAVVGPNAPAIGTLLSEGLAFPFDSEWAKLIKRGTDDLESKIAQSVKPVAVVSR
jgi:hypothetical protein